MTTKQKIKEITLWLENNFLTEGYYIKKNELYNLKLQLEAERKAKIKKVEVLEPKEFKSITQIKSWLEKSVHVDDVEYEKSAVWGSKSKYLNVALVNGSEFTIRISDHKRPSYCHGGVWYDHSYAFDVTSAKDLNAVEVIERIQEDIDTELVVEKMNKIPAFKAKFVKQKQIDLGKTAMNAIKERERG